MQLPRSIAPLVVIAALAAACTPGAARPTASPATPMDVPPSAAANAVGAPSPDAWLVVGKRGVEGLQVILASTAQKDYDLPTGVPNERWGRLLTVRREGGRTIVRDLVVQPGFGGNERSIDGAWALPTFGADALPVGVSADRQTVVLVEAAPATPGRTRFAVLRAASDTPIVIDVAGTVAYDAVSPNGSMIFVIEHLPAPPEAHYQVRAIDVASRNLLPGVVVDKTGTDEAMGGWPLAQLARPGGLVLTLYRSAEHPFIHALQTVDNFAICIDLPASRLDADAAQDWGLAAAPSGAVYAVNATLGEVAQVDAGDFRVTRTASVEPARSATIVLAKFGHSDLGPVGRRLVVSPDGATLYAAGRGGILAIRTTDLTRSGAFLDGQAVDSLGLSPDGSALYALLHAGGRIVKLDAATGRVERYVPGEGYDRLLAVAPW
ncbi:MAG TPA: hypothetical protein VKA85_10735 [Candidatus Limnocylindrales bacterium]|nr:hypothetical protein [Candidatus Limnocylindrales bacterium]